MVTSNSRYCTNLNDAGIALPIALFMLLIISAVTALLSNQAIQNLNQVQLSQVTNESYYAAEGVLDKTISDMASNALLWKDKVPLATAPSSYSSYAPASYSSTNGIPSCTYLHCLRDLYPISGGLIKNLGPIGGSGDTVDSGFSITEQYNPSSPQTVDLTLGGISAWTQVERLDQTTPSATSVGGSLSNTLAEGGNANNVRFRVTGLSTELHKESRSYATVVAIVEMPAT